MLGQPLDTMVAYLRAAGEQTRLRLMWLLSRADLTVSELTRILDQSQPRISRHLRVLVEAGLAERYQEGAWAYFRAADRGSAGAFNSFVLPSLREDDAQLQRDKAMLEKVKEDRVQRAASYFAANADDWDRIRSLHISEEQVETAMLDILGDGPLGSVLDLGTGTGRVLELLSPRMERGVGIDTSRDMLSMARANLEQDGLSNIQVRQGNVYSVGLDEKFDLAVIHQVLHYLENPELAIGQAARCLKPDGRLLIVDFAPHGLEFLRDEHAHFRLGLPDEAMRTWLADAGLSVIRQERLEPPPGGKDALTVVLWLAGRASVG